MSVLDISKRLTYEFWYDYIKLKYQDSSKLCYMDTESFVIHIKTEDFYEDTADDVKKWFDISNYDGCNSAENDKRPLPIGEKNKKESDFFKDELGRKIMKEFAGLRAKTWAYLLDDNSEKNKAKGTKQCVIKRILMLKFLKIVGLMILSYYNHNKI